MTMTPILHDQVQWIKDHSDLTWDQLGKVFGASHRAVHMWANGGRINAPNAARVIAFRETIEDIEADLRPTPDLEQSLSHRVRERLLAQQADGTSIVDHHRREHCVGPSWGAPFPPEYLVGALR